MKCCLRLLSVILHIKVIASVLIFIKTSYKSYSECCIYTNDLFLIMQISRNKGTSRTKTALVFKNGLHLSYLTTNHLTTYLFDKQKKQISLMRPLIKINKQIRWSSFSIIFWNILHFRMHVIESYILLRSSFCGKYLFHPARFSPPPPKKK